MTKFKITKNCGGIEDLAIIEPQVFGDNRGYFIESYNKKDFEELGITAEFVQDNQSKSTFGVLRGLHRQLNYPQGKLVRVISGKVFDVAVDLRKNSKTYSQWFGIELSAKNKKQFYIPEGFAHGFLVLSNEAEFCYKTTNYYHPEDESSILWNDKTIAIDWPIPEGMEIILSEKDKLSKGLTE